MTRTGGVVLAIGRTNLKRLFADRSNLFFLVVLPLLIVFALGVAVGGTVGSYRVGVVDTAETPLSRTVMDRMTALGDVDIVRVGSASELRDDVARRSLDVGWVAAQVDGVTEFRWYSPGAGDGFELRTVFSSAVEEAGVRERVVAAVASGTDADRAAVEAAVERAASAVPPIQVEVVETGDEEVSTAGIRAVLAAGQLSLFIFLASLTGAVYLLTTRRLGVTRRVRAGPVPVSTIVAGEALARFVVALLQAAIVFFGSMLLFGVDWRAPGTVWALCVGMSLVGTGAAMLLGTLGRNEQQVSAVAIMLALVLGALGGSMQPLEFFPDTLRTVAFATPHAWMNDAMWTILVDGGGLGQVWPSVVVLLSAGLVLLAAASMTLARSLR